MPESLGKCNQIEWDPDFRKKERKKEAKNAHLCEKSTLH